MKAEHLTAAKVRALKISALKSKGVPIVMFLAMLPALLGVSMNWPTKGHSENFLNFQKSESVSIKKINGKPVCKKQPCKVKFENDLEGVLSKPSSKAYVIVKPISSGDPNWYVQSPAPVIHTEDGKTWEGKVYCGTLTAGKGEKFSVFVVITDNDYKAGQQLPSEPEGIKSKRITLLRTLD